MSLNAITPVLLCGGSGTRLWPLSRISYPKQLLPLFHGKSLLQQTLERIRDLPRLNPPVVVCNQDYRFLVAEQLRELGFAGAQIILEPEGKNTAPAATLAALELQDRQRNDLMLVLPVDHLIEDHARFVASIRQAEVVALQGSLVAFGVAPNKPETGYGYIQKGKALSEDIFQAKKFIEKPDLKTAEDYLRSGTHFWNSGIFLFTVETYLSELQKHAPDILAACRLCIQQLKIDLDFHRIKPELFSRCRSESLDYALMEKTDKLALVALCSDWRDLGSWSALWEANEMDADRNVIKGDVVTEQVDNSYLHAESRLLAIMGVSNLVVIETADAVMVAHKDKCQNVKHLVNKLKESKRREVEHHRLEYRPWGYYEVLNENPDFQTKRLIVKPGAKLSLQLHHRRSEHWVVIKGRATVTCGENTFELSENQSTFIPAGVKHRLENAGKQDLEIVEVQTGTYFGEDDIVRFEDLYQRSEEEVI